jgi:hypothetical protein
MQLSQAAVQKRWGALLFHFSLDQFFVCQEIGAIANSFTEDGNSLAFIYACNPVFRINLFDRVERTLEEHGTLRVLNLQSWAMQVSRGASSQGKR